MKKRDYRDYLQDIITSIDDIASFTKSMTYGRFARDRKTVYAVTRCIEIAGEDAKKIPKSIRDMNPSIPWKKMAGMRDKLTHEYFGVDVGILWKVAREDLPPLRPLVNDVLKNL
jgi:uncharacterized protein with HEPN domain